MIENRQAIHLDRKKLQEMREKYGRKRLEKTPRRPAHSPIRIPLVPIKSPAQPLTPATKTHAVDVNSPSDDDIALERAESFIPQVNLKTLLSQLIA